jgi:hypothetical protein
MREEGLRGAPWRRYMPFGLFAVAGRSRVTPEIADFYLQMNTSR